MDNFLYRKTEFFLFILSAQLLVISCVDFYRLPEECRPYSLKGTRWLVAYCQENTDVSLTQRDLCDLYQEIYGFTISSTYCDYITPVLRRNFGRDCQLYNASTPIYQRCYPFNTMVTRAERWERPLLSHLKDSHRDKRSLLDLRLSHSGVVVTTLDDRKWLIEKGIKTTVKDVSDPGSMASDWRMTNCGIPADPTTVGIFWGFGLPYRKYHLLGPNCHTASRHMMYLVNAESC